jgi:hypothetical protein
MLNAKKEILLFAVIIDAKSRSLFVLSLLAGISNVASTASASVPTVGRSILLLFIFKTSSIARFEVTAGVHRYLLTSS